MRLQSSLCHCRHCEVITIQLQPLTALCTRPTLRFSITLLLCGNVAESDKRFSITLLLCGNVAVSDKRRHYISTLHFYSVAMLLCEINVSALHFYSVAMLLCQINVSTLHFYSVAMLLCEINAYTTFQHYTFTLWQRFNITLCGNVAV